MKTHPGSGTKGSPLPPSPAPTARDANPWPMPEQQGERPPRTRTGPLSPHPKRPFGKKDSPPRESSSPLPAGRIDGTAASGRPSGTPWGGTGPPAVETPSSDRRKRSSGVPLLILFGALAAAAMAAREAIAAGDYSGAAGPLVIALFIAFSAWQRLRNR